MSNNAIIMEMVSKDGKDPEFRRSMRNSKPETK